MEAFRKDSMVVFIGDSITYANNFVSRIFAYYLENFPELHVRFTNAGISGGTAASALLYLDESLAENPDYAVITLGVNDSEFYRLTKGESPERNAALERALERYSDGIEKLIGEFDRRNVMCILCTPAPYAEFYETGKKPCRGAHALLLMYAERIRELAARHCLPVVDFHANLSELYLDERLYLSDHIHPNNAGQARMAECFLKAQGLPVRRIIPGEEPFAVPSCLSKWKFLVRRYRMLYDLEWLLFRTHDKKALDTGEKLKIVRSYLDDKGYGDFMYYKAIAKAYIENKPREAELKRNIEIETDRLYLSACAQKQEESTGVCK